MTSRNDLVVGNQIFYSLKGDLLMEVVQIGGEILERWVNLVDVEEFERNNRVVDGMEIIRVPLEIANKFRRNQEKQEKSDDNKIELEIRYSRFLCDEDLVVGDQIYYLHSKGDVLMEVIEVGGLINKRWVKFVDVKDIERNNVFKLPLATAKTFYRKQK